MCRDIARPFSIEEIEQRRNDSGADAAAVDTARSASDSDAASHAEPTKGPWRLATDDVDLSVAIKSGPFFVATVTGGLDDPLVDGITGPTTYANAHLIASAPDLYDALRGMVASYDGLRNMLTSPVIVAKLAAADAALRKAEGRS